MRRLVVASAAAILLAIGPHLIAQSVTTESIGPSARLLKVSEASLTGKVDSNSPALWDLANGERQLFVMTSFDGRPSTASGPGLAALGSPAPATLDPWPGGGVWMEAVVEDADGTWYGYYHNETLATTCGPGNTKVTPRIGAARSRDQGATWEPLGIVLDAPPNMNACATNNKYFVGGVGDFSVMLDQKSQDLYFFVSQYYRLSSLQGVGVARLAWADRDAPQGKAMLWQTRTWVPSTHVVKTSTGTVTAFRAATPLVPPTEPWHDAATVNVDAFWGPSVHYNTYLQQYVMLLNRARNENFDEEGIYVSFAAQLDDPRTWTAPVKLLDGGSWYPQVIGLEADGTDKLAGQTARFFMSGRSNYLIQFSR